MAKKLFKQAKELGVEAKGLQREQFITEYGAADGPPAVSPQALKLLRGEAFRYTGLPLSLLPACWLLAAGLPACTFPASCNKDALMEGMMVIRHIRSACRR